MDFSNLYVALSSEEYGSVAEAELAGVAVFKYGEFLTEVINFLIIAWVVFLLVRALNRIRATARIREKAPEAAPGPSQEELLAEIRDLLREHRA